MSQHIFGDTSKLAAYVHLMEFSYKSFLKYHGENEDEAEKKSLEFGAKVTESVHNKLTAYQRQPGLVWGDMNELLFGEQNEYIQATERLGIADELAQVKQVTDGIGEAIKRVNEVGLYAEIADAAGLGQAFADIADAVTVINERYQNTILPTQNRINKVVRQNQKIASEIAMERYNERDKRARSHILASNPDDLSDEERKVQTKQVIDIIKSASPELDINYEYEPVSLKEILYGE
jgi:uncharacterized protein YoxC